MRDEGERDGGIGEGDGAKGGFDNVVSKSKDESIIRIGRKSLRVRREDGVELLEISDSYSYVSAAPLHQS